ncbi:MAG TPA: enoyl-CoA hydratase/isomerase family protein [Terriglobales bacterium]|nr:enoyl-CoA hydratase/isomerase family protein [Terriglobales bacterium]
MQSATEHFILESREDCSIIHLISADRMNRLTLARVQALTILIERLTEAAPTKPECKPLIITGNDEYFSVGADLNEIAALASSDAREFARHGQSFMNVVDHFPAPVYAAISGYCMGGGLDLGLACDFRVCSANAIFGHRGAALGLITGWGGTQRLSDLVGQARALQMFVGAERLQARDAQSIGLVCEIASNPLMRCLDLIARRTAELD